MSDRRRYLTDDRDWPEDQQRELIIFQGGNGDWYVSVDRPGAGGIHAVRICTSGGAAQACPGLGRAIAAAYAAMETQRYFDTLPDQQFREERPVATGEKPVTAYEATCRIICHELATGKPLVEGDHPAWVGPRECLEAVRETLADLRERLARAEGELAKCKTSLVQWDEAREVLRAEIAEARAIIEAVDIRGGGTTGIVIGEKWIVTFHEGSWQSLALLDWKARRDAWLAT